ncbi:MAG: 2-C-methyl-D-erythritol 4-phosphate cytidylyltransferase [Candidatus Cloacimonetes bacterium]|nr:2-C-methyl-D-erythritol 4-phosphate cytidylyltransferase [Candidatus Cloacimonadota bacterium]
MNTALIMAGGSGARMNDSRKKQFILVKNKSILQYTLEKFILHPLIDEIVVVVPEDDITITEQICSSAGASFIRIVAGGITRQQSVINGLNACPEGTDIVLIHDGVRPFVKEDLITRLIIKARECKAVIPVSKVRNTLKEVQENIITRTISRELLFNALTPQVFAYELILSCHQRARLVNHHFTDDSSILEYFSIPVQVIITDGSNLKITEPGDLEIARLLL